MTESSLQKSRKTYKKQKANSIVYGDTIHDSHQGFQQKVSNTSKPLAMVRTDHNKTAGSQDFPKKIMSNEKVNYNHELHKLLSHHKKVDSYDKNISMAQKTTSSKSSKFFLNNSLKGFQFKHPGRSHVGDSVSKRSPSFSNSNLPTDLPSNKIGSISNSSRPLFSTQKPHSSGKEKGPHLKNIHQNMFEDIKSYNHFKNSLQHSSKLIVNIKYPYYCENTNINAYHNSERVNRTYIDESIFEKGKAKALTKWKEELRKKVEARRNISKSPLQNSEFFG